MLTMSLLTKQRFLPLFITQFLGAFNDNLLKNAIVILITYKIAEQLEFSTQLLITIASGLFILPFFLFSATAGQLADKYDRATLTRIIKIAEIIIMCFAALSFSLQNPWLLILALFASGTHSTFFGPIKYALLPQQLLPNELMVGNAYIEGATFFAILFGTICGGLIIVHTTGELQVSALLIGIAIFGFIASRYIPDAPAPVPNLEINHNVIQATRKIMDFSQENKRVFISILGISWFWFIGITFLSQFPNFVKLELHAESKVVILFLTIFSVGMAAGSLLSSNFLKGQVRSTFVPIAAIGMSIFIIDLYFASKSQTFFNISGLLNYKVFLHLPGSTRVLIDLFLISLFGGAYIVPLYTLVQQESPNTHMARIIAANNVYNALFMVLSAIFCIIMISHGQTIREIFLSIGVFNLLMGFMIYKLL